MSVSWRFVLSSRPLPIIEIRRWMFLYNDNSIMCFREEGDQPGVCDTRNKEEPVINCSTWRRTVKASHSERTREFSEVAVDNDPRSRLPYPHRAPIATINRTSSGYIRHGANDVTLCCAASWPPRPPEQMQNRCAFLPVQRGCQMIYASVRPS